MGMINTKEDTYQNIKRVIFSNWSDEELGRLKDFVEKLYDHNLDIVEPFNELITAHLRIIFYVGNWYQIITDYKKKGIDICEDEFDIQKASCLLYQYVLNPKMYENEQTRVKL